MTAPNWIEAVVRDFGRGAGLADFALNARGAAAVRFENGLMYPSDRPGLGIELDEKAAALHPKADHWLRHYVGTLTNIRPPDSVPYYHV